MSTTAPPRPAAAPQAQRRPTRAAATPLRRLARKNPLAPTAGLLWLVLVVVPLYSIVVASLRAQADFLSSNPLALPAHSTLDNYSLVLHNDFLRYLLNSAIVTAASVVLAVGVSLMAAYAIVRGAGGAGRLTFNLFLLGLAIPLQATIIPIYFLITRMHLYDTLVALVLPSVAFAIPVTVLILVTFVRDIPAELFDAMRVDGAGEWRTLWTLVLPLSRPALMTVSIYDALTVWNGLLFPLILTQSPQNRVLPLALWSFQGQFTVNVPAVLAAVVLSSLPILTLYVIGRRQLIAGLTAGFGK